MTDTPTKTRSPDQEAAAAYAEIMAPANARYNEDILDATDALSIAKAAANLARDAILRRAGIER